MTGDRVAVLMGGWTSEARVSRVTASFCGQAARNAGWDAVEIEVDRLQRRPPSANAGRRASAGRQRPQSAIPSIGVAYMSGERCPNGEKRNVCHS